MPERAAPRATSAGFPTQRIHHGAPPQTSGATHSAVTARAAAARAGAAVHHEVTVHAVAEGPEEQRRLRLLLRGEVLGDGLEHLLVQGQVSH